MAKPAWLDKHPCNGCGTGYLECAQGRTWSLMCCTVCDHPGRWDRDPYTAEELASMLQSSHRGLSS